MRVLRPSITGILLTMLLLAIGRTCPAQAQPAPSESSVDQLIRSYFQAVERESLSLIEQHFHFANGEARQKVLAQFQLAFDMADTRIESIDVTDVKLHHERQIGLAFAKVRGTLTQPRLGESQTKEHSYAIFVRSDGDEWKVAKVMRRSDYDNAIRIAASSRSGGTSMNDVVQDDPDGPDNTSQVNDDTHLPPDDPSNAHQAYVQAYNSLTKLMAAGKGNTPEAQQAYAEYKKAKDLYEQELKSNNSNMTNEPDGPDDPPGNDRPDDQDLVDQCRVSVGVVRTPPLTSIVVPLRLEFPRVFSRSRGGRINVAQIEIELTYDPNVVRAPGVVLQGDVAGQINLQGSTLQNGRTRIRFTSRPGVQADSVFAQVPFEVHGAAGQRTALHVRVVSVRDDRGSVPTCAVRPGAIEITGSNQIDPPNEEPSGDAPGTITLQPVADAGVYAYSYRNWNRSNQGAYEALRAGWNPSGGTSRAYLKFELRGTAEGFTKATLRLFHNHTGGSNSLSLAVHAVSAPWIEGRDTYHSDQIERTATQGEITWVTQPPMDPTPVATFQPGPEPKGYIDVDITPLAKAWLTGKQNHGLTLTPIGTLNVGTPESCYGFCSREHQDKSKRPVLILSAHQESSCTHSDVGSGGSAVQTPPQMDIDPPHADTPTDENYTVNEQPGQNAGPILLFSEEFSEGPGGWSINGQAPTIRDGRAYFQGGDNQTLGNNVMVPIEDFAVEFDAYSDGQMLSVLVATKQLKLYAASMQRGATVLLAHDPQHAKQAPAVFEPGAWHHYRFVRFGDQIELYLDGKRVARHTFAGTLDGPGLLGFTAMESTIGLDNIRFYDLSRIPRTGTASTPETPTIPSLSRPAPVVDKPSSVPESEPNQPRRPLGRFRRR